MSEAVESIIQRTIVNLLDAHLNQINGEDIQVYKDVETDAYNSKFPKINVMLPMQVEEEHLDRSIKQVIYRCSVLIQAQNIDEHNGKRDCDLVYNELQKVFYDYPTLYLSQFYVCDSSYFRFDTIEPENFGNNCIEKPVDIYITTVIQTGNIYDASFGIPD